APAALSLGSLEIRLVPHGGAHANLAPDPGLRPAGPGASVAGQASAVAPLAAETPGVLVDEGPLVIRQGEGVAARHHVVVIVRVVESRRRPGGRAEILGPLGGRAQVVVRIGGLLVGAVGLIEVVDVAANRDVPVLVEQLPG